MQILIKIFFVLQILAGYICARGLYCITNRVWIGVLAMLMTVSVPLSMGILHASVKCGKFLNIIVHIGYLYLGFILYFSIICVLVYILHCLFKFDLGKALWIGFFGVFLILSAGYFNAMHPAVKRITISAKTNAKICFISDIHAGSINTVSILQNIARTIDWIKPDLVIFGGDTVDRNALDVYNEDFVKIMSGITAKYKVYAIVGNHEFFAGLWDSVKLMQKAGIKVLMDESINEGDLTIVGRIDAMLNDRKHLEDIIPAEHNDLIVVDHTPSAINESVDNHALLHLSGHTHGGQLFPLNFLTDIMFKPTGMLDKIDDTNYYITTGVGFWGPPYRIGHRPEIVVVQLKK